MTPSGFQAILTDLLIFTAKNHWLRPQGRNTSDEFLINYRV
jgi:hypothetical protein